LRNVRTELGIVPQTPTLMHLVKEEKPGEEKEREVVKR
jgi:hypothetical protein